jgi:hypothetical protein
MFSLMAPKKFRLADEPPVDCCVFDMFSYEGRNVSTEQFLFVDFGIVVLCEKYFFRLMFGAGWYLETKRGGQSLSINNQTIKPRWGQENAALLN